MSSNINTHLYWQNRFKTDWYINGNRQQETFAKELVREIPDDIKNEINGMTICDIGCAFSYSLPIFQSTFPKSKLYGIDFIQEAIDKSKEIFPQFEYALELNKKYDVIFSSNTLEHIDEPIKILKQYMKFCNKYIIILVPYNQEIEPNTEHVYSFNNDSFPDKLNRFNKVFQKVFYSEGWLGEQLITIYIKKIRVDAS